MPSFEVATLVGLLIHVKIFCFILISSLASYCFLFTNFFGGAGIKPLRRGSVCRVELTKFWFGVEGGWIPRGGSGGGGWWSGDVDVIIFVNCWEVIGRGTLGGGGGGEIGTEVWLKLKEKANELVVGDVAVAEVTDDSELVRWWKFLILGGKGGGVVVLFIE